MNLFSLFRPRHAQALADAQRQIDALSARCDLLLGCVQSQRATISGLSLQLCRRSKAADDAATIESMRLQLQACRRQLTAETQRVRELEAEASCWITRQAMRLPVSEN